MSVARKVCINFQPLLFLVTTAAFLIWHNTPLQSQEKTTAIPFVEQTRKYFSKVEVLQGRSGNFRKIEELVDSDNNPNAKNQVPPVEKNFYVSPDDIGALSDKSEPFQTKFCKYKLYRVKKKPQICLYKPQDDIFVSKSIINSGIWESNS